MRSTVDLSIGGVTCASCAARIERKLNRLDGVVATVNYATASAHVQHSTTVPVLVSTVESLGYSASAAGPAPDAERGAGLRVVLCAVLAAVVLGLAMVPALRFPAWAWVSLVLAAVVVGGGGWPSHRAAARALRHGTTTMDTLVSLGALVSFGWSAWLVIGHRAGE